MEDILYAVALLVIVSSAAIHSFVWTWVWLRKQGLVEPAGKRVRDLDRRVAELGRENEALAVEVERVGELHRFVAGALEEGSLEKLPRGLPGPNKPIQ